MDRRPLILVVEDEPLIGSLVEDSLNDAGFEAHLTDSPRQAIQELEGCANVLTALVTDIRLGADTDGWALARRARELNPSLPIVYISGDSAVDHKAQGVPDSIMVQKPFAPAQVVTAVSTLSTQVRITLPDPSPTEPK